MKGKIEFYAEWDEKSASYCVFDIEEGKAWGSFASLEQAEEKATKMNNNNIVIIGLIKGRHPLPVEQYILEESEIKAFTKQELEPIIKERIQELGLTKRPTEYDGFRDLDEWKEKEDEAPIVKLYITGLTIVTLIAVRLITRQGYNVEIMGFNPNTKEYYNQGVFQREYLPYMFRE